VREDVRHATSSVPSQNITIQHNSLQHGKQSMEITCIVMASSPQITSHHITVHNNTARHNSSQHITAHLITSQHSTVQYITSHHSTVQNSTVHHISAQQVTGGDVTFFLLLSRSPSMYTLWSPMFTHRPLLCAYAYLAPVWASISTVLLAHTEDLGRTWGWDSGGGRGGGSYLLISGMLVLGLKT
jgi:hypothetical protein